MRAATTCGVGPWSRLVVTEVKTPKLGPEDLLVEVHASSVNPKDWKLNTNLSRLVPKIGPLRHFHVIGDDLSGVVVEKGSEVTGLDVGDEVYGMDMRLRTAAAAEYAVIAQKRVARKPKNLSFSEAAAVPLAALTALQSLHLGQVGPGTKLLVIGASGGVGTFAVQIAKALGAEVTGVCSHRNVALVEELGADQVIDYTKGDYLSQEMDFDVIFDATSYESLQSAASLLKDGGVFITTGGHGPAYARLMLANLPFRSRKDGKKFKNMFVESHTRDLDTLRQLIEEGRVKPVIDSQYPLEEIQKAYERSKTGRARGKIVVNVR